MALIFENFLVWGSQDLRLATSLKPMRAMTHDMSHDDMREPPFVGSHTPLDLVILQLGLAVEGESAGAARGGDLDSLVDDHDVMPQALLRGEPLAAAVAVVVERGVVDLAVGTHVDHVVLLQLGHLYTSVFISQP